MRGDGSGPKKKATLARLELATFRSVGGRAIHCATGSDVRRLEMDLSKGLRADSGSSYCLDCFLLLDFLDTVMHHGSKSYERY